MIKTILLITVFLVFGFTQFSCTSTVKKEKPGQGNIPEDSLQLASAELQEFIDNGKLAGISALVVKDGEIIYKENFGFANIQNQNAIEDNTIFRIFSMTKPITAAALMTLYDEGLFQLDDEVSKYIPEFANTQVYNPVTKSLEPQVNKITIRHLLTHTAGFTYGWDPKSYVDSLYRVAGAADFNGVLADKMKTLTGMPLKNQPGTKYEYSVSIDVAGYLCEVLSGQPLDKFLKTRIFDPLKMEDTGFYVPEEKHSRFTSVYTLKNDSLQEQVMSGMNFTSPVTLFSGGGGLVSTLDDYSRFGQMLVNYGELDGIRVLKESTVKMIMSDQMPQGVKYEEGVGYGLGGSVNLTTGRYGWSGAASTHFVADPANKMVFVCGTQFMPFNISYATRFVDRIERSLIK